MELSKLKVDLPFGNNLFNMSYLIKTEIRNKLYFGKYNYKAVIKITGLSYTYYVDNIQQFKDRLARFRTEKSVALRTYGSHLTDNDYYDSIDYQSIDKFLIFKKVYNEHIMVRQERDKASIFTNDLSLLESLMELDNEFQIYKSEVLSNDTMYFKKQPKYKFRTYFKGKRIPKDFMDNIQTLKDTYKSLNFSKGLFVSLFHNNWHPYRYLHGSYFVEYNDEHMHTILAMWLPDMLGKTYSLAKEP